MPVVRFRGRAAAATAAALLSLVAVACDGGPTEPPFADVATLTVDASAGWTYVDLGSPARSVAVSDPGASSDWDLGFYATSVMLNGGAAGPAGVSGYCVCQNAGATNAQLLAMTPESELAAFEAVTAAQIPTDDGAWQSDALAAAIAGWYRYDPATHVVSAATDKAWKVRTADGTAFAKLRVAKIEAASRTDAGRVTLEFAVQSSRGAPMGEVRTLVVDLSTSGKVYVDLRAGAVSDASKWDLLLEGYAIRVNGGVSGSGKAGAVAADQSFAAIADASDLTDSHYRGDAYGGVFDTHRWYRYNLDGDHQVWPTYDVYLIRRGEEVYKVQITGYYGPAGEPRHITFRYAKLAG
jgi:hypothetical protein